MEITICTYNNAMLLDRTLSEIAATVLAPSIIHFIYGEAYLQSSSVLVILTWQQFLYLWEL